MAYGPITSWQINGETKETVTDFIFLGSKIAADRNCSCEMKRCLLLGRKAMTNVESTLKSRDITLPTKVCIVKAMVFPVVMYGCESWTIKEDQVLKNWCFWTVVLEKTLEGPLDCKEIKPFNSKGNQSWMFIGRTDAEAPILWPSDVKNQLIRKKPWCWESLREGGEEGDRRWGGSMASLTQSTWIWANPRRWWRTGKSMLPAVHVGAIYGFAKSQTRLSDWTTKVMIKFTNFNVSSFYNWWNSTALTIGILIWEYIVNGLKKRKFKEL